MVAVFLAQGFEEIEAIAPIDLMRRAGIPVTTVGIGSQTVSGSHGICISVDCVEDDFAPHEAIEAIVLPGGMPGTLHLEQSATVQRAIDMALESNAIIAAICAAPSILGHRGLLAGRRATCFPGFEADLKGARLCTDPVVRDASFITSRGAGTAVEFGLALVAALKGEPTAKQLGQTIQCSR